MTVTAQKLLEANGVRLSDYRPGQHYCRCPQCSHMRKRQNQNKECLGVWIDEKGATWHCNHCGWIGPEKGSGKSNGRDRDAFDATYNYAGFQKVRFPKGHEPRFLLRHRDGGDWKWGAGGADTNALYRRDEIGEAIALGHTVLVVEGEKDVDACWRINIPATCNS